MKLRWPATGCAVVVLSIGAHGCGSNEREAIDQRSFASCESASIDAGVRRIELATRNVGDAAKRLQHDVLAACSGLARDLEAPDTWSSLTDPNLQLSNPDQGGACDQVATRIREVLPEASAESPLIAVGITRGECNPSFERQVECDVECSVGVCDSGSVVSRCPASDLSAVCSGSCAAESACLGTLQQPTSCLGRCESDCVGNCHGTCFDSVTGELTADPAHCNGKCDSTCEGECRGVCHVGTEQGVACGNDVRCAGGCVGGFSEPRCTSPFAPSKTCPVDPICHESCSASVLTSPACAPTTVLVSVSDAAPELAPLTPALKAHFPALIEAAGPRGVWLLESGERVLEVALELDHDSPSLDGESRACLRESIERLTVSLSDSNVAVTTSQDIETAVQNRSH